jgi:hypothetical protein
VTTTEKIFTRNFHLADSHTLERYRATGGYTALGKALSMEPAAITEEVKKSNLRGLGGAAFPTGVKWGFIPKGSTAPKYLVINADEGEPGTFKDRYLLERDPHALVEGMIIAARAIGSHLGFVYIRGEYVQPWRIFSDAVKEAYAAGLLGKNIQGSGFDFDIVIHRGAGAYICGEETGLLSSLEGKKGWPKIKPPFPAVKGAFGHPTIVNNVETIAAVPHIINRGAEWFAGLGTKTQGGTRLYSVSGHVVKPGVVEAPVSTTLRSLIYDHSGGIRGGRRLKAVVPGPDPDRGRDRRGHGRGRAQDRGEHDRLGRRHRVRRHRLDPGGAHGRGALLRPRVVRPVHAVPGVDRVDLQDGAPDRRGEGAEGRPGHHPRHRQAGRGHHDLRVLRRRRGALHLLHREVPRGVRSAGGKVARCRS